ncbi:M48 family metallopeptidase [Terrimonas sp. NA20]|uniref:M48 family metallopeptidase n=1 Tax=Terrimonas ginsenosidimutans TaxID=2908004 RepID=A0ABS9KN35_9BACT|nr:M48 family metallopeptidase [Terrimonas ginsenosidimutans]MCG2613709.1 M48 family metallopeptidase [Terrimonas ginsenosidimutans]
MYRKPYFSRRSFACVLIYQLLVFSVNAQDNAIYSFQQDDTLVRKGYLEQSLKKKEDVIKNSDKTFASDFKKVYQEQFEEIAGLWKSGRVVTAPAVHQYLQSIVQEIISRNPPLANIDARIVFSRDWWPNAYSMGDGSIAVNAGLFVYFNNEAELAFVICHELAHYYLDHSGKAIRKYVETINSTAYQSELKRLSTTEFRKNTQLDSLSLNNIFSRRRHMRANEAEADRFAFSLLKNTKFSTEGIRSCLQLLDSIDNATLFQPLKLEQVFHFNEYPFRKKWVQKESMIFSEMDQKESEDKRTDSLKTHPDCRLRIEMLQDSIAQTAGAGTSFVVDRNIFHKLKTEFHYEIAEQCYRDEQLSRNLYYNLLLLQSPQYRRTAVFSIARCLNLIYDKQKDHKAGLAIEKETPGYPAEYNLLLRMLDRLRLEEIANINYHFCSYYAAEMKDYPGFVKEGQKAQVRK